MRNAFAVTTAAAIALLSSSSLSFAFMGYRELDLHNVPGCPVFIVSGHAQDTKNLVKSIAALDAARLPLEGGPSSPETARKLNLDVKFRNESDETLVAIEFLWEGLDAFKAVTGRAIYTYDYSKSPIKKANSKHPSESRANFVDATATYRVSITRAKFADGSMWEAPKPADDKPVDGSKP